MHGLRIIVAALVLAIAAPQAVRAQAADVEASDIRAVAQWSGEASALLQAALAPIQAMPASPADMNDAAAVKSWIAASRAWLAQARRDTADISARFAKLPAVPQIASSPQVSRALAEQARRLPGLIASFNGFYDRYEAALAAIERNDPAAALALSANAIDAMMLPIASMRDANDMTAASMGSALPQAYWLRSISRSYDGMLAYMDLVKQALTAEPRLGFTVERLDAAIADMTREIAGGRAAQTALRAQIAASLPSSQSEAALIAKTNRANETFPAAFDREARILDELKRLRAHLAAPGRVFTFDDPVTTAILDRLTPLDDARAVDQQARVRMFAEP